MSDPLSLAAAENFDNNDNFVKYLISNDNNNNQKKSNQDNEIETNVDETPPEVPIRTKRSNKQSNKTNNDDVIIDKPSIIIAPGSLHPNHVRWFYKEDSNTTKWTPFKGYDSISLELEFRRNESSQNYETVQILDNLYEANIQLRKYYPIYWDGPSLSITRGTWFYDNSWEPIEEELAERIDIEHVKKFGLDTCELDCTLEKANESDENNSSNENVSQTSQTSKSSNKTNGKKIETQVIYSIIIKDLTCSWYTEDDIYLSKTKPTKTFTFSFGKQKNGDKIIRGYKALADINEKSGEITHLIFVIHGIAQKLYEKSIIKNCDDLKKSFETVKTKFYSNADSSIRCEFIPVDWRSSLVLDAGIVDSITVQNIKSIRSKLNSSALDIMYYTSPLFRYEILHSLSTELNRLYTLFLEKNPNFKKNNGKVSIVAHSLGSVIVYDIITHNYSIMDFKSPFDEIISQNNINATTSETDKLVNEYNQCKRRMLEIEKELFQNQMNIRPLDFVTENLFILGSPLAVFLTLRGVRPGGSGLQDHILPKNLCKNLFNLFHPCDAIAYRLEPLILKHYSTIAPIEVHRASDSSNSKHTPYKEIKTKVLKTANVEMASNIKESTGSTISFSFLKSKKTLSSSNLETQESAEFIEAITSQNSGFIATKNQNETFDQSELETRLDFSLQSASFEMLSAITAHTDYWKSLDVAYFLITQLYAN